jgi:hypothetical protein
MLAKSREHYVEAWTSHINELISMHLDADVPINDWEEVKKKLLVTLEQAADNSFPSE